MYIFGHFLAFILKFVLILQTFQIKENLEI
jgi:hypothetical protein